jgi:hypothetical protein
MKNKAAGESVHKWRKIWSGQVISRKKIYSIYLFDESETKKYFENGFQSHLKSCQANQSLR